MTITHHGPIVNTVLGADGEQPLALPWTGLQYPCVTERGLPDGDRAGRGRVATRRSSTVPPLNMLCAD